MTLTSRINSEIAWYIDNQRLSYELFGIPWTSSEERADSISRAILSNLHAHNAIDQTGLLEGNLSIKRKKLTNLPEWVQGLNTIRELIHPVVSMIPSDSRTSMSLS